MKNLAFSLVAKHTQDMILFILLLVYYFVHFPADCNVSDATDQCIEACVVLLNIFNNFVPRLSFS